MGKITIEELSDSLKEYLNGLGLTEAQVQELIDKFEDEKMGDMSQLSTEEKGSLVGAINELFQNANNGKELIANAIGEPLNAEDTFSAMSTDINGLLSTFKTNMMNNGITVESSDRFKSLIDKIATLADNEGKGMKFVEGNLMSSHESFSGDVELARNAWYDIRCVYEENIVDFTPSEVIFINENYQTNTEAMNMYIFSSRSYDENTMFKALSGYDSRYYYITDITNTGFTLKYKPYYAVSTSTTQTTNLVGSKFIAIGVGEEDTTLRDSLASILEEEGVSVTEEDDMASLITKVDEEFDRKNANSGLDIISATELPAAGKEGQICVLTNSDNDNYILSSNLTDYENDGSIFFYMNGPVNNNTYSVQMTDSININLNFYKTIQFNENKNSYYYSNNTWNLLTDDYNYIYKDGVYVNDLIFGGLYSYQQTNSSYISDNNGLSFNYDLESSYYRFVISSNNLIDLSKYSKLTIKYQSRLRYSGGNSSSAGTITVGLYNQKINSKGTSDLAANFSHEIGVSATFRPASTNWVNGEDTFTINSTSTGYFTIFVLSTLSGLDIRITTIEMR